MNYTLIMGGNTELEFRFSF